MFFVGILREFALVNEEQYDTIGEFWDEMALVHGLENLRGLGYKWEGGRIYYAIGLKCGDIKGYNLCVELPDEGWTEVEGETENLKSIYDEIYRCGALKYEIESFDENGRCRIRYCR